MLETILTSLKPIAPLMILVAAFFDTFVGTGYLLYGFAMLTTVGMMLLEEIITIPEIIAMAWIGTVAASTTNYVLGRFFAETAFIERQRERAALRTLTRYLDRFGNWWLICIGRFVTVLRPSYGLLLGLLHRPFKRFVIYETIIAGVWVCFWLSIIIFGQHVML